MLSRQVLWYEVQPKQAVQLVISVDPRGLNHNDYLVCSDLQLTAAQVVGLYADRWCIEECFRDVKQYLGVDHPQSWKEPAPLVASPWCCKSETT